MKTDIYNTQGKKVSSVELPENVFGVAWNNALMYQVVRSMQFNARTPVAHTKGRGDVRGGGKKPWQQKGTGRARHGSIRSPIWKGGGVTHGPSNEKVFTREIPKKMRAKALYMALSRKFKNGELILVDSLGMKEPKTKSAKETLVALSKVSGFEKLASKKKNAALVAFSGRSEAAEKSFRNIGSITLADVRNLNPVSVLRATYLIMENPDEALKVVSARMQKKSEKTNA